MDGTVTGACFVICHGVSARGRPSAEGETLGSSLQFLSVQKKRECLAVQREASEWGGKAQKTYL